jgi:hypothetical protein
MIQVNQNEDKNSYSITTEDNKYMLIFPDKDIKKSFKDIKVGGFNSFIEKTTTAIDVNMNTEEKERLLQDMNGGIILNLNGFSGTLVAIMASEKERILISSLNINPLESSIKLKDGTHVSLRNLPSDLPQSLMRDKLNDVLDHKINHNIKIYTEQNPSQTQKMKI